ncbi:MAG TPA: type II secretion system F family protein, partial [Candidatus Dormibacteraeota bacterium]|nr:type II secretion system F family protein [Candidatus Dormibacteraeota bacterium]
MTLFVSVILACAVASGVFFVFQGLSTPQVDLLEARLAQFGERDMTLEEIEMTLPFAERFLRPIFERVGGVITSRTPDKQKAVLQDKINLAGRPGGLTVGMFLTMQIVAFLAGLAVAFGLAEVLGLNGNLLIATPIAGGIAGYIFPSIWLDRKVKRRQKDLLLALPNALDLLTISVEAGLGFDAAIARVCEKYHNALSVEFAQVLNEVRLGRPRLEALDDMGRRNKVEELNNFIQAVVQSEQLGVGIANVLRIQSEEIRRRRQRAEEQGQKAPLKMLFPMVGCIFPTLFI